MLKGENLGGGYDEGALVGELTGETQRQTYEQRGETTLDGRAYAEQHERELMEAIERDKAQASEAAGATASANSAETASSNLSELFDQFEAEFGSASPEASTSAGENAERQEIINKSKEKAKNHSNFKKLAQRATVLALAVLIGVGGFMAGRNASQNNAAPEASPTAIVYQVGENNEEKESISDIATYRGQFASEDGTTYNSEKRANVNFGEALKSGVSEAEMKEELGGRMTQTGQLAATYYYMQEKTANPNFGVDGAKFNNPDALLEAMEEDGDLHQKVYDYVMGIIDENKMSEDTVTGKFHNFFMDSKFETGDVDTSNMEVVGCTTNEDGTKVYKIEYSWTDEDGTIHTDTFTFKERCGGQPLDEYDFTTTSRQLPGDPENPDTGSEGTGSEGTGSEGTGSEGTGSEGTGSEGTGSEGTGSEGTGSEGTGSEGTGSEGTGNELTSKNEQALIENAGPRADWQELDVDVTPETTLKQDQENFESIKQQQQEDAARQAEAERVRVEQAEAERRAAEEAAARRQAEAEADAARQAAADEAAARATADAAEAQRQAAEAERQAAAEQAAREAAQAEADRQAAANAAAAEADSGAGANDRADMFNNGDF